MIQLRSLRAKLLVCFLLLTLIPLLATALYGQGFTREALSRSALERSLNQVHLQAESIVSALRQVQGDARYLSELRSLGMLRQQTTPDNIDLWRREVGQDLLVLASVRPMYHALRLLNGDGVEIIVVRAANREVSILANEALQDRADTAYFRRTMALPLGGVYVSPFQMQDDIVDVPFIHYAVRLSDGILAIDLHAGWLLRALPDLPGDDTWALLDEMGRFLVYPEGFDPEKLAGDVPALITGGRGSLETPNGIYVYDTIYLTGETRPPFWAIFRHTPAASLYASVNDFYTLTGAFIVASAGVATLLAYAFSRLLVKPVTQLETMAARFGHDGVAPDEPSSLPNDEIGALTRTFIDMARELEGKRKIERRLIERLIRAQEEERKLLAYDLHDGLIQQLVGARFYLSNAHDGSIQHGCDALTEAIVEGRRIIEGLRPAALDDLGLTAALQELAQSIAAAARWELVLDLEAPHEEPSKTIAVSLYRIAQEALNNARKHAQARVVHVRLSNSDSFTLQIEDDGIGFDPDTLAGEGRGLGITTMQERAALLGGTCQIQSQPGAGTRIEARVPRILSASALAQEARRW
jgi:signal transduction histidine kinase